MNRRKFIKHSALAAAGSILIPPAFIKKSDTYGNVEPLKPIFEPVPSSWKNDELNIAWIGHATILINFFGKIILTDPVFFNSVGLYVGSYTLGPKRASLPALELHEIPDPDVVLISHAHMDHMDYKTLSALTELFPGKLNCITAYNTKDVIDDLDWKSLQELDWNREINFSGIRFKGIEVNHHGWRYPGEKDRSNGYYKDGRSFNGYILERESKKILFGGDTAFTDKFKQHKHENIDVAIMPIGGYKPWRKYHCTPEEALVMAEYHLGAKYFIPMHTKTFDSGEMILEPLNWLQKSKQHYSLNVAINDIGETFTLKA